MKRREILKYTALLTGAAVSLPLALSLSSCKPNPKPLQAYTSEFFTQDEFEIIKKVVDLIIPKTDSPSATEVGVHAMIDNMVMNVYPPDAKKEYREKSSKLLNYLADKELNEQTLLSLESRKDELASGYQSLKQQTVAYYLNTEIVGTQFLNYLPVPGEYIGCIELSEVGGKAWAI